jgi:hypothetical protein
MGVRSLNLNPYTLVKGESEFWGQFGEGLHASPVAVGVLKTWALELELYM